MSSNGAHPSFITRVRLRNYRSIAGCDVELQPLAILVGPSSGKSNFLDAFRLTAAAAGLLLDCLRWEQAWSPGDRGQFLGGFRGGVRGATEAAARRCRRVPHGERRETDRSRGPSTL
jgi:hypothetical protein